MRKLLVVAVSGALLGSCQSGGAALEPIHASITYGEEPRQRLQKSPIGSIVPHVFTDQWDERVRATYILIEV